MAKLDNFGNREYQDTLVDIAINHRDYHIRVEAVRRISIDNQDGLIEVAKNYKPFVNIGFWYERREPSRSGLSTAEIALNRISDDNQWGLHEVAIHAKDSNIAMKAVNRIYNPSALVSIVKNANFDIVAEIAIEKINSQNDLVDLVLTSNNNDIINLALSKITSQANLVYIFLNTHNHRLKSDILFSISDENTLTKIVLETSDEFFIKKAISKIKDKTLLLKIINNGDAFQRREAEKKLNKIYEEENKPIRRYPRSSENDSHKQVSHNISDGNPFTWYGRKY